MLCFIPPQSNFVQGYNRIQSRTTLLLEFGRAIVGFSLLPVIKPDKSGNYNPLLPGERGLLRLCLTMTLTKKAKRKFNLYARVNPVSSRDESNPDISCRLLQVVHFARLREQKPKGDLRRIKLEHL